MLWSFREFVPVSDWWVGSESSLSLLLMLQFVFVYFSSLMLCGSDADKTHVWRTAIMKLVVFELRSFVTTARNSLLLSKPAHQRIDEDDLGVGT